jgi:hypothetical protein
MQESYRKGIANHPGPEPCGGSREAALEALDRGTGRLGIEPRNRPFSGSRRRQAVREGNMVDVVIARRPSPCVVVDLRHAWKLYAREPGDPSSARRVRNGGPEGERDER